MASSADWVVGRDAQEAIQRFSEQTWTLSHLQAHQESAKNQLNLIEDAQAEFEFQGSWAKVGEAFDLIADEEREAALSADLDARHDALESDIATRADQIRREEANAEATKKIISAALGDRVRLNM